MNKINTFYKIIKNDYLPGILNSYSIIFFLDNKVLATVLMLVTFFNFWAGLSGLLAVVFTLVIGYSLHLHEETLKKGTYSFNALLVGVGLGTFFDPGLVFFSVLAIAALLTVLLSVTLGGLLFKHNLSFLSIPFVVTFWFVMLPASHLENLGLTQRNIFWINEMYQKGGNSLLQLFQNIESYQLHHLIEIYLRSLSSIFFQDNIIAGALITIALLFSSRIMFLLSVAGFLSAYLFAYFTGSEAASITYYNIGANYMMVAFAVGGYFLIPSRKSFLWTVFLVPVTSLVLLFFFKLFGFIQLPVFSLPFAFVTIIFLFFLHQRTKADSLILTPIQHNSPEKNLYTYANNRERLSGLYYYPFYLPVMGEWTVSQGHDGEYTHKGEWGKAFDFVITDFDNKTFKNDGYSLEDYYCYNKPVFAPADGYVEAISDKTEDNIPGNVNTSDNWGNSIVIRHLTGLYTQISHLRKGSFKVRVGDFVHKGDVIANCGNSGRSPQPHVHFQVQISPVIGAKTIDYPLAYYYRQNKNQDELMQFSRPEKGDKISQTAQNFVLFKAFNLLPDNILNIIYTDNKKTKTTEKWETYTDAYNYKYIYCAKTKSTAYYVNDGMMFYFTAFYGDKNSALYYFYLSAYKIYLGNNELIKIEDSIPFHQVQKVSLFSWLHDFIAPFHQYIKIKFTSEMNLIDVIPGNGDYYITTKIEKFTGKKSEKLSESKIKVNSNGLKEFEYQKNNIKIKVECENYFF